MIMADAIVSELQRVHTVCKQDVAAQHVHLLETQQPVGALPPRREV
jgi:hypothetical protein